MARVLLALICVPLLSLLASCQRAAGAKGLAETSASGPTVITIGTEVLQTGVKRLGINLSGQTFYDSGQMLRNLTFRNPGFEGETWQSVLHCKTVTANSCTDANQYAQWPAGFMQGAQYEMLSGQARGARGTVRTSLAAHQEQGVTLEFADQPRGLAAGDFVLVRVARPGGAEAGWWKDLKGGATLSTEFKDLSPHTPGRQALRIDASAPGASAGVSSFFDSFAGRSFVQLRGRYTLSFRAKGVTGAPVLTVEVKRLDTTHGAHSFLRREIALSSAWHDYSFDFDAAENGSAVGTAGLSFSLSGSAALLDDVALTAQPAAGNPTAFRNEVVEALRTLRPGVLRYMDNGTDFGSSLDNMLAPPFARERSGASTQETLHEDIPIGLDEFLKLCAAIGAEPWYSMPPGTSVDEARRLVEYLAGDTASPYGARRTVLGRREPWTTAFPVIHLELGNEQWNARSFAGSTINDPTAYGARVAELYKAMRASPGFRPAQFDLVLGSWATVPWWTGQELRSSAAYDSVGVAPYLFSEFNEAGSTEAVFGPMFAEPEMIDSRAAGYMAQQLAAARAATHPAGLAVYEVNLGTMSGSAAQADVNRVVPSLGAGLAVADHMLLMLRDLGVTTQCLFALPEYINDFTSTAQPRPARETMPLWGAVVDMGGATDARRPQFLAEQLANAAILPTMLRSRVLGTDPTWNQPLSTNARVKLEGAHLIQSFAFVDGAKHSLILINLSRERALPVEFAGVGAPRGEVRESVLCAASIIANNEQTNEVTIRTGRLAALAQHQPYLLLPFSMTTLTWTDPEARR